MTVNHADLTGASLHEPKGVATATAGEVYVADGAGSGAWEDLLADVNNLNEIILHLEIPDVSTANSQTMFYVPRSMTLTKMYGTLAGAISGTDSILTIERAGIALGQTLTIPHTGSGAGITSGITFSPTYPFTAGQLLEVISDGGSSGASILYLTLVFTADA